MGRLVFFAPAVFLGAFLLFQVQPLIGKYILPWFGGGSEVWTVCMLFFQVLLLAGYAYAHMSVSYLRPRLQAGLHAVLLIAALAALPIIPADTWKPASGENPTIAILLLLTASVGLPYLVLAATGPLLQRWFTRLAGGLSPYRLYSLSNAASLLALLSYPLLVEPTMTRTVQARLWSAGLAVFVVLCGLCAALLWRGGSPAEPSGKALADDGRPDKSTAPAVTTCLLWLALPAVASVELLAVTNKICQDVASVPFLWVGPLSLYLLSFVICFHHRKWYVRKFFLAAFVISLVAAALAKAYASQLTALQTIAIYSFVLLACCMVCHGELFRIRPNPIRLTGYYLTIAAGGAIGGILVAIIAPLVFDSYLELPLGLLACCLLVLLVDTSDAMGRRRWIYIVLILAVGLTAIVVDRKPHAPGQRAVLSLRNFYGVLTIWDKDAADPAMHRLIMQHGTTFHGLQFISPAKRLWPTAYYGRRSGIGLVMQRLEPGRPRRVGVVGLGVGTIATYGKPGDVIRFYEINPQVVRLAKKWFSYLSSCRAAVDVVMGDARSSMASEQPQNYDVLVLDAFTSDSVPVHLLTSEAFDLYLKHLAPGGVIAAHVSTVHLDLQGVLWQQAMHHGLSAAWIQSAGNERMGTFTADWMLLSRSRNFLDTPAVRSAESKPRPAWNDLDLWTDERVNLLQILH